ncbi:MAG: hypothetical protein KY475_04030 [Planctomycetes bacterium]|nr:hypothetical protein [Planctomycetota bacterium]
MNLNTEPTKNDLRKLLAACDDTAGHHILWISKSGEVKIACVPGKKAPVEFDAPPAELQVQFEPFLAGNEYVGLEAAADAEWVDELFDRLLNEWSRARGCANVAYVDQF